MTVIGMQITLYGNMMIQTPTEGILAISLVIRRKPWTQQTIADIWLFTGEGQAEQENLGSGTKESF